MSRRRAKPIRNRQTPPPRNIHSPAQPPSLLSIAATQRLHTARQAHSLSPSWLVQRKTSDQDGRDKCVSLVLWYCPKAMMKLAKIQWKKIGIVSPNHRASG